MDGELRERLGQLEGRVKGFMQLVDEKYKSHNEMALERQKALNEKLDIIFTKMACMEKKIPQIQVAKEKYEMLQEKLDIIFGKVERIEQKLPQIPFAVKSVKFLWGVVSLLWGATLWIIKNSIK